MRTWIQTLFVSLFIAALPTMAIAIESGSKIQYENIDFLFSTSSIIEDKVYIQPDSIYFLPNQIYVKMADDFIPIQQLSCDDSGIFIPIQNTRAGCGVRRWETWKCPRCDYENYEGINRCGVCGRDREARDEYTQKQ